MIFMIWGIEAWTLPVKWSVKLRFIKANKMVIGFILIGNLFAFSMNKFNIVFINFRERERE